MRPSNKTPLHLANSVYGKIKSLKNCPTKELLHKLFSILYYVSMKTEEGRYINITITLLNPNDIDSKSKENGRVDRWSVINFAKHFEFDVKRLVKLSKAADPWSSSIAIYYDENYELYIWGMIDQTLHNQSFLNHEISEKPDQPGILQCSITGIGCLAVMRGYTLLADLKQNILISNYLNVFKEGHIHDFINTTDAIDEKDISNFINKNALSVSAINWQRGIKNVRFNILCRLLIRIQNYKHGGAILITDNIKRGLDIKYKINYNRLHQSSIRQIKQNLKYLHYSDKISKSLDEEKSILGPIYLGENHSMFEIDEIFSEIRGAIRYVSSLSCVDGLIVLNKQFEVKGFGAVIRFKPIPEKVYVSKTINVSDSKLIPMSPDHYGTRHRSMFSYCWNNENCVGFVVSQDGDIRAIKKVKNKIIIWENIKVLRFFDSKSLVNISKKK